MKTVVVGIGNRVLRDDAVGCVVAGKVARRVGCRRGVTCREVPAGGLRLMEAVAGFDRAILIDAIETGESAPGTIFTLKESDLRETRNTASTHDGSFRDALEFGRAAGLKLPVDIRIWAIEAGDVATFSESLTSPVRRAAHVVASRIVCELMEAHPCA